MTKQPRQQEQQENVSNVAGPPFASASAPVLFLRSKLLPPRPAPALVPRPRLMERLRTNLVHPVTLVTANAGSGKTTLVADFVQSHARQCVWYQLDRTDSDPFVFLGYIAHGIRQALPEFGQATLAYLHQAPGEVGRHPDHAVDVLLNEVLDCVEQPLVLVLDDYHHLDPGTPVHGVLDRLIAYQPDVMHTIVISRDVPPLRLARLRSQTPLAIIDRSDLLFTDEEIQGFFRCTFDLELTPEQLAEYRQRTQGWITALQLVRQFAQRQALARQDGKGMEGPGSQDLTDILRQSERDIFDYFAEEVFADEQPSVQRLLLRLSLLERLELDLCGQLYPEANCSSLLPGLVRRNVFMTTAGDGRGEEYRLHPLFQSFLRRRLRAEIGRSGVASEHTRVAEFFFERDQWKEAMHHLIAAEAYERAAEAIEERGEAWIASGALASLVSFVSAIPKAVLENHPRALLYRAEVARLRGEYDEAQASFRHAASLLRARCDCEGEAEAFHSLATIARKRGDFEPAFESLDRAVQLSGEHSRVRIKCGNTRGLCLVSQGHWTEAEREFRIALQEAEEQKDDHHARLILHNLGLPAMMRGDFGEAERWLSRLLGDEAQSVPVPQEATAHLNLARCFLYRGDFSACEHHLERALSRCQLFNLIEAGAEVFETYGNLSRERGDLAQAAEAYERARRAYDKAGIDQARRELLEEVALLKLMEGNISAASALLDQLLATRAAINDEMGLQTATLARGRVLLAQDNHDQARAELQGALQYFRQHSFYYYEAQACMTLALCDLAAGHEVSMFERLRRAIELAARYDYAYWLRREVAAHPEMFALPDAAELLPPDAREVLSIPPSARPVPVTETARAPVRQAADLTIRLLGPVEIFRDRRRSFAADAWTTKRSRDILCFIASRRHRRAPKDVIMDTFWGEADFDTVTKNFHPTISHIRKALNSNQPFKQNFLLYRDGYYQLSEECTFDVDTEEFDQLVSESEAAHRSGDHDRVLRSFEEAIKLYRGEFMQGCYDSWVEEQRLYYREHYLRMLESLASAAMKSEEWPRTLQLAREILQHDPYREDIHCLVMRAHAALGNRVAVKEQFELLRGLLKRELGVEPAAETQRSYRQLTGSIPAAG